MTVRLDIVNEANLARAFGQAPEIVLDELSRATWEAELLLQREIQEATPVGATGLLRASISAREPKRLADQVIGEVGTAIAHAVPVELGTRPHFPPIRPLADWVVAKLGVARDQAERVGFLIARKIAQRGTKGAGMFAKALAANRAQVARIFDAAAARIASRLADEAR
jgi:hypothetical protein